MPRYPVYVPSKGRAHAPYTARFLMRDGIDFRMVIESNEFDDYAAVVGAERLLVLPFRDRGLVAARNWIREHSISNGDARHWQIDDNVRDVQRLYRGKRLPAHSGVAMRVCEDFTDRYTNIGVSGLNYRTFAQPTIQQPFYLNCKVYSYTLVNNQMPYHWRMAYNDDTDLCLQVLSAGLCTVTLNIFMADKLETMRVRGGNTDDLYQGDGRLRMSRSLERVWPHVVETRRRFDRPQHVIRGHWRRFDTKLIRRDDIDFDALPAIDEYGLQLVQKTGVVRSAQLRQLLADAGNQLRQSAPSSE